MDGAYIPRAVLATLTFHQNHLEVFRNTGQDPTPEQFNQASGSETPSLSSFVCVFACCKASDDFIVELNENHCPAAKRKQYNI